MVAGRVDDDRVGPEAVLLFADITEVLTFGFPQGCYLHAAYLYFVRLSLNSMEH